MTPKLIAGVDEAGRGPLAGPVVAAAVILDSKKPVIGLADSKILTEKQREQLYIQIVERSIAWAVGEANVEEIDSLNIYWATLLAMRRAILALVIKPDHVKVDGNKCPDIPYLATAHVGGDRDIAEISAASIIAKVTRDRQMVAYGEIYPKYGFANHKGYGTTQHLLSLQAFGATPIHRRSFEPVKQVLSQMALTLMQETTK